MPFRIIYGKIYFAVIPFFFLGFCKSGTMSVKTFQILKHNSSDELQSLLKTQPDTKKLVSGFVNVYMDQTAPSTQHLRSSWKSELGVKISADDRAKCLRIIHTCSINSKHQLIQVKDIHRLHDSCVRLHSFYPSLSPPCIKCKHSDGTLAHMFWFCTRLDNFWAEVFHCYADVYRYELPPSHWKILSIQHGIVIAKEIILKVWNKEIAPCFETWLTEFSSTLFMEKIRYEMSGKKVGLNRSGNPSLTISQRCGSPHDTSTIDIFS